MWLIFSIESTPSTRGSMKRVILIMITEKEYQDSKAIVLTVHNM